MLHITIPDTELWDDDTQLFTRIQSQTLTLEHSLVSLATWESKWEKPFISNIQLTEEEQLDYIKCMTITQGVDPLVYKCLSEENAECINKYIAAKKSAAWFSETTNKNSNDGEMTTAESIYYWMTKLGISSSYESWHLNRLIALIRFAIAKEAPPKKMSADEITRQNAQLNAERRAMLHTKG